MVYEPPSVQDSVRFADFTGFITPIFKRPLHLLADGSAVAVIPQTHNVASPYGTKDNQTRVEIWHAPADRSTWTKKSTYTVPAAVDVENDKQLHCGAVLMNDESVFFVWRGPAPGYSVYATIFTKTGAATWGTPSSYETAFTPTGRFPFRFDLDVNRATGRVFIGWAYRGLNSATDTIGADILARLGVGSYDFTGGSYDLGGNSQQKSGTEDFTFAIDPVSDATYTRLMYCVTVVNQTRDYGDMVFTKTVRNSDNTPISEAKLQTLNIGRAASRRDNFLFASANAEWSLIGAGGANTVGEAWAGRIRCHTSISSPLQSFSFPIQNTYSAKKFYVYRSNSLYSDITVTYANDKFNVVWHDENRAVNLPGRFEESSALFGGKAFFDTAAYWWDNARTYNNASTSRGAAPAGAVYGAARGADATNQHDTLITYFSRSSLATTDSGWMHQFNRPSRAPANVTPELNSIQNTSLPVVAVYADLDQRYARSSIRAKWQIAKDAGFSLNLIEHTKADGVTVAGTNMPNTFKYIAEQLPLEKALQTGAWYIRAAHLDAWDTLGSWSTAQAFSVLHKPYGLPISPARGAAFEYGDAGQVTFTWTVGDGYLYDKQTAYRVLIETNTEDPTVVLDTGKVTSEDSFATLSIPSTAKNVQLRWTVQLWDIDDSEGDLSSTYALFIVADPPSATINNPVSGVPVDNARPYIEWTYSDPTGATQAAYRVVLLSAGVAIFDSGWRVGAESSFQADEILLANEATYSYVLYVRNTLNLESSTAVEFTTEWIAPADPDLSSLFIDTTYYDQRDYGYVKIQWGNQTADPEFLSWRLYRRAKLPESASVYDPGIDWELVQEEYSVSPPEGESVYTYLDYTAPSNHDVHYMLTQTSMRFGSIIESRKLTIADMGKVVSLYSGAYWLIDPSADGQPEDAIRLAGATADSYADEYESEEMFIVGRGRHVEVGDRRGYAGTLAVPLRFLSDSSALDGPRRQKLDLERFKANRKAVLLRSPFGDVFLVKTGDIQFDRVPGVGSSEFLDVSIPYAEVFK